jgi:hypothetical protein
MFAAPDGKSLPPAADGFLAGLTCQSPRFLPVSRRRTVLALSAMSGSRLHRPSSRRPPSSRMQAPKGNRRAATRERAAARALERRFTVSSVRWAAAIRRRPSYSKAGTASCKPGKPGKRGKPGRPRCRAQHRPRSRTACTSRRKLPLTNITLMWRVARRDK